VNEFQTKGGGLGRNNVNGQEGQGNMREKKGRRDKNAHVGLVRRARWCRVVVKHHADRKQRGRKRKSRKKTEVEYGNKEKTLGGTIAVFLGVHPRGQKKKKPRERKEGH